MNLLHKIPEILVPIFDNLEAVKEGILSVKGYVTCEHYRKGDLINTQSGYNTFMTDGMAKICNVVFGATSKTSATVTCVGIFKGNVTPAVSDTASAKLGALGTYQECQDADYTPATNRPVYTIAATTTAGCTNAASKAEFTMAAAITVYGAFLSYGSSSTQAKTSTSDTLMCAKRFSASRATEIGDVLAITYALSLTTS